MKSNRSIFGVDIKNYETVTSTFDKLLEFVPDEKIAIVAKTQTNGIGRMDRQWKSDCGGLYFSYYILPDSDAADISFITIICAVAMQKVLGKYIDCKIKWPNDIVFGGKKLCGILVKSALSCGKVSHIAAGIGVNVANSFKSDEMSGIAVSLYDITGEIIDKKDILNDYFDIFEDLYLNSDKADILSKYSTKCITVNNRVTAHYKNGNNISGICTAVCDDGSIDIKTDSGEIVNVCSGEVSVRGIYGYV